MTITKNTYRDSIIYKDTEFTYYTYSDVSDEQLIEIFKEKSIIESKKLTKGTSKNWIASKINLYGVYISRPELFNVITPNGLNAPYSFYKIILRENYNRQNIEK